MKALISHNNREWLPGFLSFIVGALTPLAYSPFNYFPLIFIFFGLLCGFIWQAATVKQAVICGFLFGLGLFGTGVSWIYISLHTFGGMPPLIAAFAVFLLCCCLAIFPALAAWLIKKLSFGSPWWFVVVSAAAWTLTEWSRGWVLTGFPWLSLGYSQIPNSPLAGIAAIGGIYAISFVVVMISALLAMMFYAKRFRSILSITSLVLIFAVSWGLKQIEWTTAKGKPITVTLLQGNIPQELKFLPEVLHQQLQTYLELSNKNKAQLVVMPESSIPLLRSQIPDSYLKLLKAQAQPSGDMLVGMFDENDDGEIFNSIMNIGNAPTQTYHKVHLVPFGEFIPFKGLIGWVYNTILNIPLSDQSSGAKDQKPIQVAGEKVAVNICYEDAFGEEIIRQLPEATMLANVSNDAWFGEKIAPWQHTQIAQTRALETGRYMLRATNTGVTSIINHRGEITAVLPQLRVAALNGIAQGRAGSTPYIVWGNWFIISISALILLSARGKLT